MSEKFLVAYATWAGATHQIADEMAKEIKIKSPSTVIDVLPVNEVNNIADYKAVIMGTSIHASQPTSKLNRFIRRNRKALSTVPVAVFVVCANMWENTPKAREETTQWINKTLKKFPEIQPASLGLFAGAVITEGDDFNNLNFLFRKTIEAMRESLLKQYGKTDFRDWDAIRAWTNEVVDKFK
jgi:menaquinone-dependent protoporphyrinogen oxidase